MNAAPERPQIPPVTWFAVAMCAGSVAVEYAVWPDRVRAGAMTVAVAALALAVLVAVRPRLPAMLRAAALLACAGLLTGCCVSALQFRAWLAQEACVADCGAREWTGVVEADPMEGAFGASARVRLCGGPLDGAVVRVGWPQDVPVPDLGRTVR